MKPYEEVMARYANEGATCPAKIAQDIAALEAYVQLCELKLQRAKTLANAQYGSMHQGATR